MSIIQRQDQQESVTTRPIISGNIQQGDVLIDKGILPQNISALYYETRRASDHVVNLDYETHMRRYNGKNTPFLKASTKRMRRWRANPANRQKEKEKRRRLRQMLSESGKSSARPDENGSQKSKR